MRKLEIGTQQRISSDWEILDIVPGPEVDIVADISKPLPIPTLAYDLIYMSHVLEHIEWYKVDNVLSELYRILAPSGSLEIFVPDIDKIIKAYLNKEIPDEWYRYNEEKDPFVWFAGRIYTHGERPSDFHKSLYNYEYLEKKLKQAGFKEIKRIYKPRGYDHGYINLGVKATK